MAETYEDQLRIQLEKETEDRLGPIIDPLEEVKEEMRAILDREPSGLVEGAPHFKALMPTRQEADDAPEVLSKEVEISQPNRFRRVKRTITEYERDIIDVANWYLLGMNHHQISEKLCAERPYTIRRAEVSKMVHRIYQRWQRSYLTDMNTLKIRELAKIDRLEREYWSAWEQSKEDKLELERTQIDDTHGETKGREDGRGGGGKQAYSRVKTITKKSRRDPNAVYLEGIRWCVQKRCEIFGLNAATNVNINWRKQAENQGLDPEAVLNDIEQQFIDAARLGGVGNPRSLGTGAKED